MIHTNNEAMLGKIMDVLISTKVEREVCQAIYKLIESYGDLRVLDAEIKRLAQEPDQWKKDLPGYYPNNAVL